MMKKINNVQYDGAFDFESKIIYFCVDDDKRPIIMSNTGEEKLSRYFNFFDEHGQSLGCIAVYDTVEKLLSISSGYAKEKYLQLIKNKR